MRLVLVNVPEPEQVVAELVALVRPGGMVAIHDTDWGGFFCYPPYAAWDQLMQAVFTYSHAQGIDLLVGRRVPVMLRAAGVAEVHVRPVMQAHPSGHPRRLLFSQIVDTMRDRLIAHGLLTDSEATELLTALRAHLNDPETLVVFDSFFQAWGRKTEV